MKKEKRDLILIIILIGIIIFTAVYFLFNGKKDVNSENKTDDGLYSLSGGSFIKNVLNLFGYNAAFGELGDIYCRSNADCPKPTTKKYCEGKNVDQVTVNYKCVKKVCLPKQTVKLKENCGTDSVKDYTCQCVLGYSVCIKTILHRGCEDGKCYSREVKYSDEKDCGGILQCDINPMSPNYGHCKDDCDPKCGQCQDCFTWNPKSYCVAGPNGATCSFSDGSKGVCEKGKCIESDCFPVPNTCQKCDSGKNPPINVPDSSKNGATCKLDDFYYGFCKDGKCLEKTCENLGLTQTCGPDKIRTTCCNPKTQTTCGCNSMTPMCCDKASSFCNQKMNLNGELKILDAIEKVGETCKIDAISQLKFDPNDDFSYFCDKDTTSCNKQGMKLCSGTLGNSCCPRTGSGSICVKYVAIPPEYIPTLDEILAKVKKNCPWIYYLIPAKYRNYKPEYTIGICGDKTCPSGTFACDGSELKDGSVCCKSGTEICSYDSKYGPIMGSVPHCQPKIFCGEGYTTCAYKNTKICCKNGLEVCINFPISNPKCQSLGTPKGNPAKSLSTSVYLVRDSSELELNGIGYVIRPLIQFEKEIIIDINYSKYDLSSPETFKFSDHDAVISSCDSVLLDSVNNRISVNGGSINLSDEIKINVPAGALKRPEMILIEKYNFSECYRLKGIPSLSDEFNLLAINNDSVNNPDKNNSQQIYNQTISIDYPKNKKNSFEVFAIIILSVLIFIIAITLIYRIFFMKKIRIRRRD